MKAKQLEAIIGLEIHLQLNTQSKMFCRCSNQAENDPPNTAVCPVCLGHPGTLPVVNKQAVMQGLRMALALNCAINRVSSFDRKNYFYPDLPKGYQITQYEKPLAENGFLVLSLEGEEKRFGILRLHLEEDAAKNMHQGKATLVDFNRGGDPLAEIVTKPDFRTASEAKRFLQELRLIARYLRVCDGDMEKGHLRCDANISLRPEGSKELFAKTEIKNLNSFRSVEKAINYEIERQGNLWQSGKEPKVSSTRGWDESKQQTVEQRTKEAEHDYRYFPEPDLPALEITEAEVAEVRAYLPELPQAKCRRFGQEYFLPYHDAEVLAADSAVANYYEQVISELRDWLLSAGLVEGSEEEMWQQAGKKLCRLVFGWITTEMFKYLNAEQKEFSPTIITPENFAEFVILVYQSKINSTTAQKIFSTMIASGKDPSDIVEDEKLGQDSDLDSLRHYVREVLVANPEMVAQYKAGKEPLLQFFVGQVMKLSKGRANPQVITDLIKSEIQVSKR